MSRITEDTKKKIMDLAKEAGGILLHAQEIEKTVEEKSGRANFVTAYDKKVQAFLFESLKEILPRAVLIGEEEETHAVLPKGLAFIVDPIDGTTNFMKGYCVSAISIGLLEDGEPLFGVVYNPYLGELFHAARGEGAFCNGKPIHVSPHRLGDGIVIFGTAPYNEELSKLSFRYAYEMFTRSLDVRRSGSSAIDVCNVACGRAELFFELLLSPWDYAASSLILTEAGGVITGPAGEKLIYDSKMGVIAGNAQAHKIFVDLWQERGGV